MVGSRSSWAAAFAFLMLFAGAGCKCDKEAARTPEEPRPEAPEFESTVSKLPGAGQADVLRLIPAGVDLAVWAQAPDQVKAWLDGRGWWKGVVASPVWEDLALSGPLYELSTARHRLASMSPVELREPKIDELLARPMALALKRTPEGMRLLLIKRIDLKVQALARLAEVFNQVRAGTGLEIREIDGIALKSFDLGTGQEVHYALFSNLLLISNDGAMLEQAVALAGGKKAESLLTAEASAALFTEPDQADLGVYLAPAGVSRWLQLVLPLRALRLDWRLGQAPSAQIRGLADAAAPSPSAAKSSEALGKLIPLDSRMAVSLAGLDLAELWSRLRSGLIEGKAEKVEIPAVEENLLPALSGEAAVVITRLELPVPQAALLLHAKPGALKEAKLAQTVAASLGLFFGSRPAAVAQPDLGGLELWSSQGGRVKPAFALMGDWLVIGSSAEAVRAVVLTQLGKSPALADRAGFSDRVATAAEPFFGLSYIDFEQLFGDLLDATRRLMASSERFDANDFDDTLAPLFQALEQVGRLGGGLGLAKEPNRVQGRVVAL